MAVYEKNYTECIIKYRWLDKMKKHNKYKDIISSYNIRKSLDSTYNRLVDSLTSDLFTFNEDPRKMQEIVNLLIEIKQMNKAKVAILNIKSKEIEVILLL